MDNQLDEVEQLRQKAEVLENNANRLSIKEADRSTAENLATRGARIGERLLGSDNNHVQALRMIAIKLANIDNSTISGLTEWSHLPGRLTRELRLLEDVVFFISRGYADEAIIELNRLVEEVSTLGNANDSNRAQTLSRQALILSQRLFGAANTYAAKLGALVFPAVTSAKLAEGVYDTYMRHRHDLLQVLHDMQDEIGRTGQYPPVERDTETKNIYKPTQQPVAGEGGVNTSNLNLPVIDNLNMIPPNEAINASQAQSNRNERVRSDTESQKQDAIPLSSIVGGAVGFVVGIMTNLIAAWVQQDVLQNNFTPINLILIIAASILGIVLGSLIQSRTVSRSSEKRVYWVLTGIVASSIVVIGIVAILFRPKAQEPATVYLVVDATAKMQPIFADVRTAVQLSTSLVRQDTRIGVRTYGGRTSLSVNCQDSDQLLPIATYGKASSQLDAVLSTIQPGGYGSLTGAVLEAIYTDLAEEPRPIQLVVITSGTDPLCDPQAGGILESRAKDVKGDIEVLIVSIGETTAQDSHVLDSYAEAFGGRHIHIGKAEELPIILQRASYYGYGYYEDDTQHDYQGFPDARPIP